MTENIGVQFTGLWVFAGFAVAFLCGVYIGRAFSTGAKRIKALRAEVEEAQAELARTRAELEETGATLEETRREASEYRHSVTEHFSKAADLFNSLTVNYRAVYEHLAKSSLILCDDNAVMLSEGMPTEKRLGNMQNMAKTGSSAPKLVPIATATAPELSNPNARASARPDTPKGGGSV